MKEGKKQLFLRKLQSGGKMIVYTSMNEAEIRDEVLKDLKNVFPFVQNHKDPKFRKMVIKASRFPVKAYTEYVSQRKNRWLALFEARNKKEGMDQYRFVLVCLYDSPHGRYAVSAVFDNNMACLMFFAPHFFGRYAERMELDLSGTPLIRHYFENNHNWRCDFPKSSASSSRTRLEIFATSAEGIGMGYMTDYGNIMLCTFITYEMAKGEQVWQFAQNDMIRKEMFTLNS
jgi:hypothetical protein